MPVNKLIFEADLDASGVSRGLRELEARAEMSSARMERTLSAPGSAMDSKGLVKGFQQTAAESQALAEQKKIAAAQLALDAEKRASNAATMATIIADEKAVGIMRQLEMDAELARIAELATAKKAAELSSLSDIARRGGVGRDLAGGHGTGSSGIIAESFVILRELSRGNFTRIPGSLTILASRLGLLGKVIKSTAAESVALAAAENKLATQMAAAALVAEAKAARTTAAAAASGVDAVATQALAAADIEGANAARANALAQAQKAEAAQAAAEIQISGAVTSLGPLGIVASILVAIGAGAFIASKHVDSLVDKLSGIKPPDFEPDYIAKRDKKTSMNAEGEKEVTEQVEKTIEAYNSAAEAAQRTANATKGHYEHLLKMNELEKEIALTRAKTPAQKQSIEKEFSDKSLKLRESQRKSEVNDKANEAYTLRLEAQRKKQEADAIDVSSKKADEETLQNAKNKLDAANQAVAALDKKKNASGILGITEYDLDRAYTASADFSQKIASAGTPGYAALKKITGGQSVTLAESDAAEKQMRADQAAARLDHKNAVDNIRDNDDIRKKKEETRKAEAAAAAGAKKAELELGDLQKKNAEEKKNDEQEAAARLYIKSIKSDKSESGLRGLSKTSDSLVSVGNFLGTSKGMIQTLSERQTRLMEKHLPSMDASLKTLASRNYGNDTSYPPN